MTRRGMTLPEVVVALSLTVVVAGGVYQLHHASDRAFERISRDVEVQRRYTTVLEPLLRELRRAACFWTPGGRRGRALVYRLGYGAEVTDVRIELRPGGRLVRIEPGRETTLGRDLPVEELAFELVPEAPGCPSGGGRLLSIRARLAWTDPGGGRRDLETRTRVMARNAPLAALRLESEDAR